jgi:hypothetical protein
MPLQPIHLGRRDFICKASACMLLALCSTNVLSQAKNSLYWAGTAKQGKDFLLIIVDSKGQVLRKIKLPSRGHGVQKSVQGQIMVCGRRPGSWVLLLQHKDAPPQWIRAAANRPLSGHCCFSADGDHFYSSENALEVSQGAIGVWDSHSGERRSEWPSQGIGPHEIQLSSDGMHLWVANGGILTHPHRGREKLNLDTMESNISYFRLNGGVLMDQYAISEPQLSLRHICVNKNNQVAVACQYQGPNYHRKPLLLFINDHQIDYLPCDPKVILQLNNYLGSVTFDISGRWVAASSPRGSRVVIWHLAKGIDAIHSHTLAISDACGLSAHNEVGGFIISTGTGRLYLYAALTKVLSVMGSANSATEHLSWDNHLANTTIPHTRNKLGLNRLL